MFIYSRRFRFRSSSVACCSSSGLSAVSAGFSKECTLLAILDRLVAGKEVSCRGNLGPNVQLLSAVGPEFVWSGFRGGVA